MPADRFGSGHELVSFAVFLEYRNRRARPPGAPAPADDGVTARPGAVNMAAGVVDAGGFASAPTTDGYPQSGSTIQNPARPARDVTT